MDETFQDEITFSFVAPVCDEQEGIEQFYTRLKEVADNLGEPYEIIFVNDGSQDDTGRIIRSLVMRDTCVRAVEFSRNFGHQVAVTAGYDYARGRAVITLDADGQHPPELIEQLVAAWREGFEVVYTVRKETDGLSRIRSTIGRAIYRLIATISGAKLTDQADFRLLDRKAVDALKQHREHARFVRGLVRWIGFRQTSVGYVAQKRAAGRSSYTLKQLSQMAGAGIFNFSVRPLRLAVVLGAAWIAAALLYTLVSLILLPFGISAGPLTHLLMFVVGMFGVNFLLIGIVGEYVGRIFEESKGRPLYIVRETIGFADERDEKTRRRPAQTDEETERFSVFT